MIWILFIATMAVSLWAAARVKSLYGRYSQLPVRSGWTGLQVAAEILRRKGIYDVAMAGGEGRLGDHYDRRPKLLPIMSGDVIVNVAPKSVDVEKVAYELNDRSLVVTDGGAWTMDVEAFGWG